MRSESAAAATPMRPYGPFGNPSDRRFQVLPPSMDRYRPLPGPPLDRFHGVRRASHNAAKRMLGFSGLKATSIAPVFAFRYSTLSHVLPPSWVRKTPRSVLGP